MKGWILTRRIVSFLLVFLLTFTLPLGAIAEDTGDTEDTATVVESGTTGDVTWTLYDNGEFVLSGIGAAGEYGSGTLKDVLPWYAYRSNITKVVVGDGVTSLGARSFYGCANLIEVDFSQNTTLAQIGEGAFRGCTSLTGITLPSTLTSLGRVCFYGDSKLESVVIGGTMTTLPDQLFDGCTSLTSVTIPGTVTTLSAKSSNANVTTFYNCTTLTSINFGGTVEQWKALLANGNSTELQVETITVTCTDGTYVYGQSDDSTGNEDEDTGDAEDTATVVATGTTGDVTWTLYTTGEFVLSGTGATAGYPGSHATTLPWYNYRDQITKIVIGEGVTELGERIFHTATNLTEVDFSQNTTLTTIGSAAFRNCTSLTSITLPSAVTALGRTCFYDCSNLESVDLSSAVNLTTLNDQTFTNCGKLTTVKLPASITTFANSGTKGPFYKAASLNTIYYGGTVTQWEALLASTYADEVKSSSITVHCSDGVYIDGSLGNGIIYSFENGVLTLNAQAGAAAIPDFGSAADVPWAADAATITKVVVKSGITGIGANVFDGCENIAEVIFVGNEAGWATLMANSGENNDDLFDVTPVCLASGKCGDNATFTYDVATKCLTISGTGATYDYDSGTLTPWGVIRDEIETLIVTEGITYLGDYLFNRAVNLSSVTLPVGFEQLEVSTFGNCTSLKEFVFQDGLKIIGSKAFAGCTDLAKITIPGTVEAIDMKAFENTALTDVYYNGTEGDWGQIVISTQAQGNDLLLNANIHYLKSVQTFTDVGANSAYYDAVTYLTDNGYLMVAEDAFGIDEIADMEMLLEMLYANAGSPGMYDSPMDWAVSNGLTDKGVNAEVSLTDIAVLLYRTAVLNHQTAADTSVGEESAALAWCTSQQYFAQIDTNDQTVTRGEAALIMAAFLQSAASDADRSGEQLAVLKNALSVEGGDGMFYIYAPDISVENATTKRGTVCSSCSLTDRPC